MYSRDFYGDMLIFILSEVDCCIILPIMASVFLVVELPLLGTCLYYCRGVVFPKVIYFIDGSFLMLV